MVAGGSWTACYHFVRNLRRRDTELTVVAPWSADCVNPDPFGCEVRTALLEVLAYEEGAAIYLGSREGPYRRGPARGTPYPTYKRDSPAGYGRAGYAPYRTGRGRGLAYDGYAAPGRDGDAHAFFDFMRDATELYAERLLQLARKSPFSLIHAQDWVTFEAAARVSRTFGTPWIAHFHSIEQDRRPHAPDAAIERIERAAAQSADFIVTPSRVTARRVADCYGAPGSRIEVVPNVLSTGPARTPTGTFGSTVIFLGRLELQKAPDRFAQLAARVRARRSGMTFRVFGDGQLREELADSCPGLDIRGPLEWNERWSAFDGATALIVPSRAEPFGMVVLEAMQCGVPVLYSGEAGVAEVVSSGIPIEAGDVDRTADQLLALLSDRALWGNVVDAERREIRAYPERGYECRLLELYAKLAS